MLGKAFAIGLVVFSSLAYGADAPPQWLSEVATRQAPEYDGDIPAVVLFEDEVVRVDASGKVTTTRRGAIRVLQRSGDRRAVERVFYTTDTDRVSRFEGWLLFPSGGHKRLGKKDVVDQAVSQGDSYNELRMQWLSAEGQAGPGTVFGFESVLEERSIFAQFQYRFQDDLPTLATRFTLQLPPGWTAESTTFNAPAVEPLVQGSHYTWEMRDLPAIKREALSPSFSALAPRLAVTYFPASSDGGATMSFSEWHEVSSWLDSLSAPRVEPDATITQRAQELITGAEDEWERLSAIGTFAQGVKVRVDSDGHGNRWRLHAARGTAGSSKSVWRLQRQGELDAVVAPGHGCPVVLGGDPFG